MKPGQEPYGGVTIPKLRMRRRFLAADGRRLARTYADHDGLLSVYRPVRRFGCIAQQKLKRCSFPDMVEGRIEFMDIETYEDGASGRG